MWSWKKCGVVSLRIGLVAVAVTAAFWYIWAFFAPIPSTSTIGLWPGEVLELPFRLSRGSDVVFAPAFVALMVTCYGRTTEKRLFFVGLGVGLVAGFGVGLGDGLGDGLVAGLGVGLVLALGVGLVGGFMWLSSMAKPFFDYVVGKDLS